MAASTTLSLTFPEPGIAVLTLDDPESGANVLSRHVLDALERQLDDLDKRPDLVGLIIRSAKPGMFIAGADLKEFAASLDAPKAEVTGFCRRGQQLFGRLSHGKYVTVAAIDGMCVGGGAELAIWCDRRVMTDIGEDGVRFSRGEAGPVSRAGAARPARRGSVGLANAVELITGGENIDARTAAVMGLANDVVTAPPDDAGVTLLAAAIHLVRAEQKSGEFRRDRERWAGPIGISDTELGFLGATASAYIQGQTKGHYPAPLAALEVMLGAAGVDVETACQMEADEFPKLVRFADQPRAAQRVLPAGPQQESHRRPEGREAAEDYVGRRCRRRRDGAGDCGRQRAARHSDRPDGQQRGSARPRRAGCAQRGCVQQAAQGPGREAGRRAGAARERHVFGHRAQPLGHHHRSDHRESRSQAASVRPDRAARAATMRSCAPTLRRFRSRSSRTGWSGRNVSAACIFSIPCGRCRWWK